MLVSAVAVRETHHKPAVDLLQDGLLVQGHGLALPLLDPLLLQLLTRVHLPGGPHLARTHLGGQGTGDGDGGDGSFTHSFIGADSCYQQV